MGMKRGGDVVRGSVPKLPAAPQPHDSLFSDPQLWKAAGFRAPVLLNVVRHQDFQPRPPRPRLCWYPGEVQSLEEWQRQGGCRTEPAGMVAASAPAHHHATTSAQGVKGERGQHRCVAPTTAHHHPAREMSAGLGPAGGQASMQPHMAAAGGFGAHVLPEPTLICAPAALFAQPVPTPHPAPALASPPCFTTVTAPGAAASTPWPCPLPPPAEATDSGGYTLLNSLSVAQQQLPAAGMLPLVGMSWDCLAPPPPALLSTPTPTAPPFPDLATLVARTPRKTRTAHQRRPCPPAHLSTRAADLLLLPPPLPTPFPSIPLPSDALQPYTSSGSEQQEHPVDMHNTSRRQSCSDGVQAALPASTLAAAAAAFLPPLQQQQQQLSATPGDLPQPLSSLPLLPPSLHLHAVPLLDAVAIDRNGHATATALAPLQPILTAPAPSTSGEGEPVGGPCFASLTPTDGCVVPHPQAAGCGEEGACPPASSDTSSLHSFKPSPLTAPLRSSGSDSLGHGAARGDGGDAADAHEAGTGTGAGKGLAKAASSSSPHAIPRSPSSPLSAHDTEEDADVEMAPA